MTQADLAAAVRVSRSAVAQWETQRSGQVRGNLTRIASVLGVSVEHLLSGTAAGVQVGPESATQYALLRLSRLHRGRQGVPVAHRDPARPRLGAGARAGLALPVASRSGKDVAQAAGIRAAARTALHARNGSRRVSTQDKGGDR